MKKKTVKAWAILHKHKELIMEIGFVDAGNFKPSKDMFLNQEGIPIWQGTRYKLIPVTITYEIPSKKSQ